MNKLKALLWLPGLFYLSSSLFSQQMVINGTSTCAVPNTFCSTGNVIPFEMQNLQFDPDDGDAKRTYNAFWVTGDGNYLQFDGSKNAESLMPTYLYPATGTFSATSYLTGIYTNRNPPPRSALKVSIGNIPTGSTSTVFSSRLGKAGALSVPVVDLFSDHAIRKKNMTTFVISWPGDVNATGIYLFYNGYQNSGTGALQAFTPQVPLLYELSDVPAYFLNSDAAGNRFFDDTKIEAFETSSMQTPGLVDGISFASYIATSLQNKFSNFVYFPAETATRADMPNGFTENRLFAVLRADSNFVVQDSFLNFMVFITGNKPAAGNNQLSALLEKINSDFNANTPFGARQQEAIYVQAADELQLEYLTTFDPNQLLVEQIDSIDPDKFEVTFRLEMCNKGRGNVEKEFVSLSFPSDFHSFVPNGFTPLNETKTPVSWDFTVNMTIPGVEVLPDSLHEESECVSIVFKAKTNCKGVKSLWKSADPTPVKSCVVFDGGMVETPPECHAAIAIDSTQFNCYCCNGGTVIEGDNCWVLWCLLILVLIYVIWWFYQQNS